MRLVSALLFSLIATSAFAQQCDRWTAKMEEDEGGPLMMASICAQASASEPEAQHAILVQCAGKDALSIRYLPFADGSYPPGGDEEYKTKVAFSLNQEMFTLDAHFEGMDGALVMETDIKSPFVDVLMAQKDVTLADVNSDKVPVATFPLKGVKKAFDKLIKTCE